MLRALLIVSVGLCLAGCNARSVHLRKSVVVPHLAPPGWAGQPIPARVGLGVKSSNLVLPPDASAHPGRPSGIYLAQSQAGLEVRARLWGRLEMAGLLDLAFDQTAAATTDGVAARSSIGPVTGLGWGSRYVFIFGAFQLGIGLDLLLYSLPVRFESGSESAEVRDLAGVYSFSLLPSYRFRNSLAFFGGVTARNHPNILKSTTEALHSWDTPDGASPGPTNVILSVGAAYQVSSLLLVHGQLYQNVVDYPVAYRAPGVELGITALLGEGPRPR